MSTHIYFSLRGVRHLETESVNSCYVLLLSALDSFLTRLCCDLIAGVQKGNRDVRELHR